LFLQVLFDFLISAVSCDFRSGGDTVATRRTNRNRNLRPKMIVKLTKRAVHALAPGNRPIVAYDTDLKGFGVRVALSGALSWFIEYRPGAGGRRVAKRRMYFGGREFTPEQARQAAKEMLASVALGKDPAAARREERESETFREFAERYLREEAEAKLKPGTVTNYRICVRKHAVLEIGAIKLNRISTADVSRIHSKVGETRPMTANRIVECISSIFRYAATCNLVPVGHNPTKGIRAFRESRRERLGIDLVEELDNRERLFRRVDQMRGIVGRLLPARGGGGEEAGMAAHDDGHIDAGHGAKIEIYADKGISDEGGG
jgi:hypothetical protein